MNDLEVGITYVNAPTIGAEVQLPFGGTKETGPTDTREAGTTALEEFTSWKTIGRGLRPNASSEAIRRRSPEGPCSVP